jgi:BirA family biotin operon repressor/biotin-[acetyl-CoA-carboxylase] ligase
MQEAEVQAALGEIPLSGLRFFESLGSTNDEAAAWVAGGAADWSLVIAEEQTAGRGRSGSKWFTPKGTALAFSLVLRPPLQQPEYSSRLAGLGALAVAEACTQSTLRPSIKWPNDVLLRGRKVAGVLVESIWTGDRLEASVLGIGVNVLTGAVPPESALSYPATCLESELGHAVDRPALLRQILGSIRRWREILDSDDFLRAWEDRLAFRGRQVAVTGPDGTALTGTLLGLDADGSARLQTNHKIVAVRAGQISLRPTDDRMG